jgi:hypothetical protein
MSSIHDDYIDAGCFAINGAGGNRETTDSKSDRDDCRLADYFDYVAGTSMGGIIAAGIAIRTRVRQVVDFYLGSAAAMFRRHIRRLQIHKRAVRARLK